MWPNKYEKVGTKYDLIDYGLDVCVLYPTVILGLHHLTIVDSTFLATLPYMSAIVASGIVVRAVSIPLLYFVATPRALKKLIQLQQPYTTR